MELGWWGGVMDLGGMQKMGKYDQNILYKIIKVLIKWEKKQQ